MKTGMEYPLIGVIVVAILVSLWNIWAGMQVDFSVAALNATIAGQAAPEPVMVAGQWVVKAIVGTIIGGTVTAATVWVISWARRKWRAENNPKRGNWKSGPNAQWERMPRAPSETELMRMALMRSLAGQGQPPPRPQITTQGGENEEPQIYF
jgi:hypothetical protein